MKHFLDIIAIVVAIICMFLSGAAVRAAIHNRFERAGTLVVTGLLLMVVNIVLQTVYR